MARKKVHQIDGIRIRFDEPVEILAHNGHYSLDARRTTTVVPRYDLWKQGICFAEYLMDSGILGAAAEYGAQTINEMAEQLRLAKTSLKS